MRSTIIRTAILLVGVLGLASSAAALGVVAHQEIAKSAWGSISSDCSIPVRLLEAPPFSAKLNDRVCKAIRGNREAFLSGAIGPDAFPDLIVGQMTTHPGVAGAWQSADWLRHVLTSASTDDELAFAYGFVVHGATDVFAHSYVNHYAGDIFDLTKGGTIAEARHFAMEKFIDVMLLRDQYFGSFIADRNPHTKSLVVNLVGTPPADWLSRVLILDSAASAQYGRVPAATHLIAMRQATMAIAGVGDEYRKLRGRLVQQGAQIAADVLLAQAGVTGAKALLLGAETHANNMADAWKLAREALEPATAKVERLRRELDRILTELNEVNQSIAALEADFSASAVALNGAQAALAAQDGLVRRAQEAVGRECTLDRICTQESRESLCWASAALGLGFWQVCLIPETVCRDVLRETCAVADLALNQQRWQLERAQGALADAQSAHDNLNSQLSAARVRKLSLNATRAAADVQLVMAQIAMEGAQKLAREHERFFVDASAELGQAQQELKAAEDRLGLAQAIETAVKPVIDRFDLIDAYLREWDVGGRRAAKEYIEASWAASRNVANGESGASPYLRWLDCSYRQLLGVPGGILDLECNVRDRVQMVKDDVKALIEGMPQELQWLLNPLGELEQLLMPKLKEELNRAISTAANAIAGEPTGRFFQMLSGYAMVDEGLLTSVFDDPIADAQRILRLPNIVAMLYEDMGTTFRPFDMDDVFPKKSAHELITQEIAKAVTAKSAKALAKGNFGIGPVTHGPVTLGPPFPFGGDGKAKDFSPILNPEPAPLPKEDRGLFTRYIATDQFMVYRNAQLLSVLSLLEPEELNRLVRHLAPDFASTLYQEYATPLYDERASRPFTLLYDSVRSLDGNQQWQDFGLPYPRSAPPAEPVNAQERRFGFGVHDHPEKGLRLFADPLARQRVFRRLFAGPIEGALLKHPAMSPSLYKFTACPANPFPATTTVTGEAASSDPGCSGWAAPTAMPQLDSRTPNMSSKSLIKVKPKLKDPMQTKPTAPEIQKLMDSAKAAAKSGG